MRKILFKAKRVDNGEWVFGDLFRTHDDHHSPSTSIFTTEYSGNSYGSRQRHEIDPETVCQFTGLLDKNGVEIYEGDVLKSEMYGSGVVRWDSDKTEFVVIDGRDRYFVLSFGVVTKNIHDK